MSPSRQTHVPENHTVAIPSNSIGHAAPGSPSGNENDRTLQDVYVEPLPDLLSNENSDVTIGASPVVDSDRTLAGDNGLTFVDRFAPVPGADRTIGGDDGRTIAERQIGISGPERTIAADDNRTFTPSRSDVTPAKVLEGVAVPGYDLLSELGRGGMGVVYKARDRRLNRLVALKMILGGAHVGSVGLARFRAEAEAVAKLRHPNIVQIYETGEHEGRPYFSLEFVEGGSLEEQIRKTPATTQAAAEMVETLARAMDFAHQNGIVHRDLKPANVLLASSSGHSELTKKKETGTGSKSSIIATRVGIPKIADFGLAKTLDQDSGNTQSGTIMGTPCYMAPEQARGENSTVGPPADIYALGSMLYEMLVGRPPFKANSPIDTVRQVIDEEPVPPRRLEPRTPLDLETICLKCLAKDPARRFATAKDLADDLRRYLDGHPIVSRPVPALERVWKWAKRRPAIVALIGVCALAVSSTVSFIAWHNLSLSSQLDVAIKEERLARAREQSANREKHLALIGQEAQKLFDDARVSAGANDWTQARLQLEKSLATIDNEPSLESLKGSAQALLKQAEQALNDEASRKASQARFQEFGKLRNEARFLGTLYTGMDLSVNLDAARTAVQKALGVWDVLKADHAVPKLDNTLSGEQRAEVLGDCYELLLILAETDAQTSTIDKPTAKATHLQKALGHLEHARALGTPSRAFHLRRARYLKMLGDQPGAVQAEKSAENAPLDSVLDRFLLADELYRREQFDVAIKEFDEVLARNPSHFWAQYLDSLCLLRQKRPAEARALLSACLSQRTDFVWLYLLRGFAQEELQAWDAAEADFAKAAQLPLDENTRYVLLVYRGVLRIRTERYPEAITDLNAAVKLKPKAYQAFINLANAYRSQGNRDQAVTQLNEALRLEPGLAHIYRLRARLELERNEPKRALADFNEAIKRETANSPFQATDLVERGRLLLREQKAAEALASFDAALALKKDYPQAQRLKAETLFQLGRFEEVVTAFDRYLETGKPLESVYRGRGLARAELGKYPGAIEDFTKAIELNPTSAVQAYRGWMHLAVDAPKLAERDFELAIELDSKNADAYTGRGMSRANQGRFKEAIQDATTAVTIGPPSSRLIYNAARVNALCPNPAPAIDLIRQALSLLPAAEQGTFWAANIQKDPAFASIRRRPAYIQIEDALKRGNR